MCVYTCVCVCVSDKSVCMQFTSESKDQDRQRIYHHCMAASTEGKHTQSQKSKVTPGEHIGISLPIKPNSFTDTKYTNKTDPLTQTHPGKPLNKLDSFTYKVHAHKLTKDSWLYVCNVNQMSVGLCKMALILSSSWGQRRECVHVFGCLPVQFTTGC